MLSRRRQLFLSRWLTIAALAIPTVLTAEPLRLVASFGGQTHDRFAVGKQGTSAMTATGPLTLPNSTEWRIEGDVAPNAQFLRLSPFYLLEGVSQRRSPFADKSGFSHSAQIWFRYAPNDLPPWPSKALDRALIVFAWIVDGKPVRAAAVPVLPWPNPQGDEARITFLMDEADAAGFPAVLLWKDGGFIAPAPIFREPEGEAWLNAIHFTKPGVEPPPAATSVAKLRSAEGSSPMQIAAESGLASAVSRLLESTSGTYARTAGYMTVLESAASKGRTAAVHALISAGARINETGWGRQALRNAVLRRHDATAALLVDAGARFDGGRFGYTPAMIAVDFGLPHTLAALATKGGIAPLRDRLNSRLADAVARDPLDLVTTLLSLGADARYRASDFPLLVLAAQRPAAAPIIRALLAAGADPSQVDPAGVAPLAIAARAGELENARALLAAGASPVQSDRQGLTALHYAAAGTEPALIPLLTAAGADLAGRDETGSSPLATAFARQTRTMIAALVESGSRIDLHAAEAPQLLAQAVLLDQHELLRRAAEDGWDPSSIAGDRWSPLALAHMAGAPRVADWLEHRGLRSAGVPRLDATDIPPRPLHTPVPADPRVEDVLFPESTVMIKAIAEADGSLSHVIAECPHDHLRSATLAAARTWRFAPATKAGRTVAIAIVFPVEFPERDNRLFALNAVDRQPVGTRSGSLMKEVSRRIALSGLRWQGMTEVGFVVERDGSTSHISLRVGVPTDIAAIICEVVASTKFKPAQRAGQPVRCWIEVDTGFSLRAE
jgi:ankyrin repeat protein